MAGSWEFPGGKLKACESRLTGLKRELLEELGIAVDAAEPLVEQSFRYPDRTVRLDVWWVLAYRGEVTPCEGQPLRWVDPTELTEESLLPADAPIVDVIRKRLR